MSDSTTRICNDCKRELVLSDEFWYRDKRNSNFRTPCKTCTNARNKAWKIANSETYLENQRLYSRAKYHENPEKERARFKRWRLANLEYNRGRVRNYYCANKDKERARHIRWKQQVGGRAQYMRRFRAINPFYFKRLQHRRRAILLNLPSDFTADQWRACKSYFNHRCAVCGRERDLFTTIERDHWIPVTAINCPGDTARNIVPLCSNDTTISGQPIGCNQSKNKSLPEAWLIMRFGTRKANQILARIQAYFDSITQSSNTGIE